MTAMAAFDVPASAVRAAARRWEEMSIVRRCTTVCLAIMVVGGVGLRIWDIGYPSFQTFDEAFFDVNAQNYLLGLPDVNDHPPLGKLIEAIGILLFGYNSVGRRFASLCFGLETILVAYWFAQSLFSSRRAGAFAAAFFAADGFFVAYSRAGLLDGILCCFILFSVLLAVTARGWPSVLASAVFVGLAASIKWSGVLAVLPAAGAVLLLGRAPPLSILLFAATPLVHVGLWSAALRMTHSPSDLRSVLELMARLYRHHLDLGKVENGLASPWYSWIALYHPIVVKLADYGRGSRYASSGGNPVLWVPATLTVVGLPLTSLVVKIREMLGRARPGFLSAELVRRALVPVIGWAALIAPWTVARGKFIFWYHYMPSWAFAVVLFAGVLRHLEARHPRVALGVVVAVMLCAAWFAPVWGEWPLSLRAANLRLWFVPWRP